MTNINNRFSNEYRVDGNVLVCKIYKSNISIECKFDADMIDLVKKFVWKYNNEVGVYTTIDGKSISAKEVIGYHAFGHITRCYHVNDNQLDLRKQNIRLIRSVKKEKVMYYKLINKKE